MNSTRFTIPPAGTVGNVGRNLFDGPNMVLFDFSVQKSFPVRENMRMQFRMDFFNLFNHPNFSLPGLNIQFQRLAIRNNAADVRPVVTSAAVGTVGSTLNTTATAGQGSRIIQFGLRLDF